MFPAVDTAWQAALRVLQPSQAELEHGLELHRTLGVCDAYGFLPRVFTPRFCEENEAILARGVGAAEWQRHYWSGLAAAPAKCPQGAVEFHTALRQAGLRGLVHPANDVGECLADSVALFAAYRHLCNEFSDTLTQVTDAEELAPQASGRMGIVFSLTGLPVFGAGSMADPDALLDWVQIWRRFGVRFMHLGYNRRNLFADGCTELEGGGLSDFGRALLQELFRTGIVPDLPHSSPATTLEAARCASGPVIASHTACAALHAHPRCKEDAALKAIAGTGGYIGITAIPLLLGEGANLLRLLAHVRHAVSVVGAEHVVIATDNSHLSAPETRSAIRPHPGRPRINRGGWHPGQRHGKAEGDDHLTGSLAWTNWPLFTVGLVQLGLKDAQIAQILNGNLRRVLRES